MKFEPGFRIQPDDTEEVKKKLTREVRPGVTKLDDANARLEFDGGQGKDERSDQAYFESMEKQMILESQRQMNEIKDKLADYAKESDLIMARRRGQDAAMAEAAANRQTEIVQMIGKYSEDLESIAKTYPDMAEEAARLLNKAKSVSEYIGQL